MANLFPPDLRGYVHGFSHQPEGSIVPFAYHNPLKKLCSRRQYYSLRLCHCRSKTPPRRGGCMTTLSKYNVAELRDIQEYCYVHKRNAARVQDGIREPYKIYKMYKSYEMYEMYEMYEIYEEYEVKSIWNSTVFTKESKASHLPEICLPVAENT